MTRPAVQDGGGDPTGDPGDDRATRELAGTSADLLANLVRAPQTIAGQGVRSSNELRADIRHLGRLQNAPWRR